METWVVRCLHPCWNYCFWLVEFIPKHKGWLVWQTGDKFQMRGQKIRKRAALITCGLPCIWPFWESLQIYVSKAVVHRVPLMLSNFNIPFSVTKWFNYKLMKSEIWILCYMQKFMSIVLMLSTNLFHLKWYSHIQDSNSHYPCL